MGEKLDTEQVRGNILQYLAQEKNSHASQVVGLAVILFAYLDMATRQFFPLRFQLKIPSTQADWQYILVFMVLVVIVWGLVFELLRLNYYSYITKRVLIYNKEAANFKNMWNCLRGECEKEKWARIIPFKWLGGPEANWRGGLLSIILSLILSSILAFVLFFKF